MNIISRLEHAIASHPAKPAFIFFSTHSKRWEAVTFKGHADLTQRFASGVSGCGVTSNMRVALMTPPSTEFFALLKLGIVPILL